MAKKSGRNTRGKIISAAWKLFYEQGYDDTTVEDIVFESETSKGSFYHYFDGKDALLGTLAYVFDEKYEQLKEEMDPRLDAWQELRQIMELLDARGCGQRVRLDFSLGNDMKYYSGLVFKGYARGLPAHILSGGQYDLLLRKMGKNARAIGFALYLDQLGDTGGSVDTLLLYGDAAPADVLAAVEQLPGTVLAAKTIPADRTWNRLAELHNGEVRYLD